MSLFGSCFLPAQVPMWNDLLYPAFDTRMKDGFEGVQPTVGYFSESWFLQFSVMQVLVGL